MHILVFIHKMSEHSQVFVALNESVSLLSLSLCDCVSVCKVFCLPLQVLFVGINKCFPFLEGWFK